MKYQNLFKELLETISVYKCDRLHALITSSITHNILKEQDQEEYVC